ncbi:MAG: molybdopterin-dependent oxidoreductase [Aggregatilineales bacterium]
MVRLFEDARTYQTPPEIHLPYWSLTIGGQVERPRIFTHHELQALPQRSIVNTVVCAGAPFDTQLWEASEWRGVPVPLLLQEITRLSGAMFAEVTNARGYKTSLPLRALEDAIIAFEKDGAPLTPEDGFPARLIIPGRYGYKQPRWLTYIALREAPSGFWEERGWPLDGLMPALAAFDHPQFAAALNQPVRLSGYLSGGARGSSGIALRADGGPWMPVMIDAAPGHSIQWSVIWTPRAAGSYPIEVCPIERARRTRSTPEALHQAIVRISQ